MSCGNCGQCAVCGEDRPRGYEEVGEAIERSTALMETSRRSAEARVAELETAAQDAGTHPICTDTCGVCGKHFEECEVEMSSHDDPPWTSSTRVWPSCPGARIRAALAKGQP